MVVTHQKLYGVPSCWNNSSLFGNKLCILWNKLHPVNLHILRCIHDALTSIAYAAAVESLMGEQAPYHVCNLVVHSDGGTRSKNCSAGAWVLEVGRIEKQQWTCCVLARGGTFLSDPISSFLAEGIALEESSLLLRKLVVHLGSDEPPGKRMRTA